MSYKLHKLSFSFVAVSYYKSTMPAKRKNTGKQASNGKAKQAKQDGQKAISHEINVPIDEGFKEGKLRPVPDANWHGCPSDKVVAIHYRCPKY